MKKILVVPLVAALALGVAACGKSDEAAPAGNDVSVVADDAAVTDNFSVDAALLGDNALDANASLDLPLDNGAAEASGNASE